MKLKSLLEQLEWCSDLVIWSNCEADEEPLFSGIVADVPWSIVNYPLAKGLNEGECALRVSKNDKETPILVICINDSI